MHKYINIYIYIYIHIHKYIYVYLYLLRGVRPRAAAPWRLLGPCAPTPCTPSHETISCIPKRLVFLSFPSVDLSFYYSWYRVGRIRPRFGTNKSHHFSIWGAADISSRWVFVVSTRYVHLFDQCVPDAALQCLIWSRCVVIFIDPGYLSQILCQKISSRGSLPVQGSGFFCRVLGNRIKFTRRPDHCFKEALLGSLSNFVYYEAWPVFQEAHFTMPSLIYIFLSWVGGRTSADCGTNPPSMEWGTARDHQICVPN